VAGSCGRGNEPSNSIKDGEFLGQHSDQQLIKKNFFFKLGCNDILQYCTFTDSPVLKCVSY
jgi:hypothetical protein